VTSRARAAVLLTLPALASCNGSDDESGPMAVTEPPATGAPADDSAQAAATGLKLRRVGTFSNPTYVTAPPGDRTRLFVVEQGGTIRVVQRGRKRAHPYLDIRDRVLSGGERGLLSMAFAPGYRQNHRFYVYYTNDHGDIRVVEFKGRRNRARRRTARPILRQEHSRFGNHNGGQLQFGPDGYLYWSTGDDGHSENAQDLTSDRGKILRIDPRESGGAPYTVPPGNPFVGVAGARPEIWAMGLRNPWRFSFDRGSGALVVGDVGQRAWEEVDYASAAAGGGRGLNYGWPQCEAFEGAGCTGAAFAPPIYAYSHTASTGGCAIVGGYVVRDPELGALYGRYLFADLCAGELRSIDPASPPPVNEAPSEGISFDVPWSFGEDACGRLYVATSGGGPGGNGQVFRLTGYSSAACPLPPPPGGVADSVAPQTSLKLKPRNRRHSRMRARISTSEPGSTFECRLDHRRWKPCGAKKTLRHLRTGRHRFRARATDAAGNTDPEPAKRRFKVKPRRR
jgi:glucose/arabinose dehydrogenase